MPEPVRLGVVTDIQYADKPDTYIDYARRVRRYALALTKAKTAVKELNTHHLEAVLQLGDIVDGNDSLESTRADLEAVLDVLAKLRMPIWHALGNHCLEAGRDHLLKRGLRSYDKYDIGCWRIVMLDTVDISVDREEPHRSKALQYLEQHAGEENANDWNGGLGDAQKEWLRETLKFDGNVLVCGHLPVVCCGTREHIIWESEELHNTFVEFGVKAYFAGHYHEGDYVQRDGVHYVTFESILDSDDEQGSYGIVELCEDKIVIKGYGDMTSRTLEF